MKKSILILLMLAAAKLFSQQFQPLFLIEWGDSNNLIPVTSNFMGFDGVQVYKNLDAILVERINALGIGNTCTDTINQVGHGFSVGDLIGQTAGNGPYFLASTDLPENLPVAAVYKVIDADNFVPCNEGFFSVTHGLVNGNDYFLQDNGSLSVTPDSTYNVFGLRTFGDNIVYIDIPELVIRDTTGEGSSTFPDQDADWFDVLTSAPPTSINDDIYTNGNVGINVSAPEEELHIDGVLLFENYLASTVRSKSNLGFGVANGGGGYTEVARFSRSGTDYFFDFLPTGTGNRVRLFNDFALKFEGNSSDRGIYWEDAGNIENTYIEKSTADELTIFGKKGIYLDGGGINSDVDLRIVIPDLPEYANDAAADADANLPSGGLYKVTGDRTVYIKP